MLAAHPAVTRARELLDRDNTRKWTLDELARDVGLARGIPPATLFAREIGMTPHRHLNERRLHQARHLLTTTDLSVTAIGLACGYGSGQHFARVFRQLTGTTPREHRRAASPPPAGDAAQDQAAESRNGKWRAGSKTGTGW
ncbi:helix-turn-helix domain-containing protein [Micromonospora inositola]|uniref:Helix-turn-helix domain-containing protein n=1 Tax=Micromonospora inositola TaxID=47865 RepID=A0A1C5JXD6_9ACTN|nr:helix-turn-helix transcriptional regulator [Micromonospora inositola]SCG74991.1 Helix-turn-helix domain-containing protein [Micromonospora inositola]